MPTEAEPFPIHEPDHLIRIHLRFQLEDAGFTVREDGGTLEIDTAARQQPESSRED